MLMFGYRQDCLLIVLQLACLRLVGGACWKHATCNQCISEGNDESSCMWYTLPRLNGIGSCISGLPGQLEPKPTTGQLATDSYGVWSMTMSDGTEAWFNAHDVDQTSESSCYLTPCVHKGQCDLGYFAVENEPCYTADVFPDYRKLKCCRQQRNVNGYLRGFEAENGIIQGNLYFAACCANCYPGQVVVGCTTYHPGECEQCPSGRFNPTGDPGSTCESCQPCEAGKYRRGCGPSTAGLCQACEIGQFKTAGLEGLASDRCQDCPQDCPDGYLRFGCGDSSPGRCEPCLGKSYFASPYCRNCDPCFEGSRERVGCGGHQPGVCSRCSEGEYEAFNGACFDCPACTASPDESDISGLNFTGDWVRIGCGGFSQGTCVRLAAKIEAEDSQRCPTPADSDALCEGATVSFRWVLAGLPPSSLSSHFGDCTAASGLCLSAAWRVTLHLRSLDAFGGTEVQKVGDWFSDEIFETPSTSVNASTPHSALGVSVSMGTGLPKASAYYLRVEMMDKTGSSPGLVAESIDFGVYNPDFEAKAILAQSLDKIGAGHWEEALTELTQVCGVPSDSAWLACERAKAIQLGIPSGQRSLMPFPLLTSAPDVDLAAMGAWYPVNEARKVLESWEEIFEVTDAHLPANISAWQALLEPLFTSFGRRMSNSSDNETVNVTSNSTETGLSQANTSVQPASTTTIETTTISPELAASPLAILHTDTLEAATAADSLAALWRSEVSSSVQDLEQRLHDLKDLDRQMADNAFAAEFDLIRMAQAVTFKLTEGLHALNANTSLSVPEQEYRFSEALQRVGITALMLIGSWGHSWRHSIEWRLLVEPGDELSWPPSASVEDFGGVAPPEGAIEISRTKARVWQPFVEIAEAWLSRTEQAFTTTMAPSTTTSEASAEPNTTFAESSSNGSRRLSDENVSTAGEDISSDSSDNSPSASSGLAILPVDPSSATTAAPTTTTKAGQKSHPIVPMKDLKPLINIVREVLQLAEKVTEEVVEPLTREHSLLLAGRLPNISVSSSAARGGCFSFASTYFSEELAMADAWEGFGVSAIRPWIDPRVEDLRLTRAAGEIIALAWGRLRLLEELLAHVADLREIQGEPHFAVALAADSRSAADHMTELIKFANSSEPSGDSPDAAWHWRDIWLATRAVLDEGRNSAARLARRRLGRLERLAAWVAGEKDNNYFAGPSTWRWRYPWAAWSSQLTDSGSSSKLWEAASAARSELVKAIGDVEADAARRIQAHLRIEATADSHPVTFAGLKKSGTALFRFQTPPGKAKLMMHAEVEAFLLPTTSELVLNPLMVTSESLGPPAGVYSSEHIELTLRRFSGAYDPDGHLVEPPEPTGVLPFVTRHEKDSCLPFRKELAEEHPELVPGALLPLDGLWMLQVRDGQSGNLLEIDDGTVLRILFKVDVPDGVPPWKLLTDLTDVLYRMPADGQCDQLKPILGQAPETSTFPPTTRMYSPTTTFTTTNPSGNKPRIVLIESEDPEEAETEEEAFLARTTIPMTQSVKESQEPWTPPMWLLVTFFFIGLGGCAGMFALGSWYRKRRRRLMVGKISPDPDSKEEHEEEKDETEEDIAPKDPKEILRGLRQRLPSPKSEKEESSLRQLGSGEAAKEPAALPVIAVSARHWDAGNTDTPRGQEEDKSPSGSENGADWSEASTPDDSDEGSTPRSARSGSSLGSPRSSTVGTGSSSSSSGRILESPRAALAAKAAARAAAAAANTSGNPPAAGEKTIASLSFPPRGEPAPAPPPSQLPVLGMTQSSAKREETVGEEAECSMAAGPPRPAAELASTHVSSESSGSLCEEPTERADVQKVKQTGSGSPSSSSFSSRNPEAFSPGHRGQQEALERGAHGESSATASKPVRPMPQLSFTQADSSGAAPPPPPKARPPVPQAGPAPMPPEASPLPESSAPAPLPPDVVSEKSEAEELW
mmetsp:Transcript_50751/g.91117  ORF Transcript_50751/g.91117 Transcript_50751/m.91117 type:complete len:1927 (-) Transcript_50751:124-5904(-)